MNIVLIALDTQRADHLGCYGYPKRTSPFLDSIARRGVLYEHCYAPNVPTHPSFTTLFSGKEAITHGIVNIGGGVPIKDGVRLLPEILRDHGYTTVSVDTMGRHFERGFDQYINYDWDRSNPMVLRKAEAVNAKALPLIEELRTSSRPFFLFLHYWDPHTPYLPPPAYRRRFYPHDANPFDVNNHSMDEAWSWEPFKWYFHSWMPGVTDADYVINLQDGETASMDHHLRQIFRALAPIREETLVIVTADHGEILNDHLGYFDHHGLYEGNVHIPLILYWPGSLPAGRRVRGYVQNLDIAPTLLELAGIPDRDYMEGLSLLPTAIGLRDRNYEEVFFSEATWEVKRAIRTKRWKLIDSIEQDPHGRPMQELFDLEADPAEQHNVIEVYPDVRQELQDGLHAWVQKRLAETGRSIDPLREQGACATSIGQEIPGETVGPGATPLHKRANVRAATIPAPAELRSSNEVSDNEKGTPLHGYVDA